VICIDKTGTLTEGKMKVVKTDFTDYKKAFLPLILTNEQRTNLEISLWDYVKKNKVDPQIVFENHNRVYGEPFDSEKKYGMTINKVNGKETAFILGAPEIVLSFCDISDKEKNDVLLKIDDWAGKGLRILGCAFKEKGNLKRKNGYQWLGLVGIEDPIRPGVKNALLNAQKSGIKIKIITGDYRKTAENVARKLGLKIEPENVLEGHELEAISEEELKEKIDDIVIFARVSPHQKLKIVNTLKEKGEVVAMTGDGVNDAPALKKADIGIVVEGASDVAKEAGDLVLLDSNFKTILDAVEEGRLVFSNIKKMVGYVLSNSFAEISLIFGSMLLNFPTPLTVIQILWIHLICDGPPDILLSFEPKEKSIMDEKPENIIKEGILSGYMKFLIVVISLTIGILSLIFFRHFLTKTGDLDLARSVSFATIASASLIYIFSFKNLKKSIIKTENFFQNKYLFLGVLYGFLLVFAAIYIPTLNRVLGTKPLNLIHWLLVFGVGLVVTIIIEFTKILNNKRVLKK